MQGSDLSRGEPLFCEIPCGQIPDVAPGSMVRICKTVYGLTDAPYQWNQHLDNALQQLGYRPSILDACIYMLHINGVLHGVIMLATDDLINGGTSEHWERMEKLRSSYRFGKWDYDSGRFCGKDINRLKDGSITISQQYYAELKCCERIHIPKHLPDEQECTPDQVKDLRSKIGALCWLAKETRIDLAGATAILMQCFPTPCVRGLKVCNRILKEAFSHRDLHITLRPIPVDKLSILVSSDASWGNAMDEDHKMEKSQAGYIVMATDQDILQGSECEFGLLAWKVTLFVEEQCPRVVQNPRR